MNIQDFTQRNESQIDNIFGAFITDSEEKVSPKDLANWINSKTQRISVPSTATSNILIPTTATFLAIPSFSSDFATVDTINNVITMTKNGFLKGKLRLNVLSTSSFIDIQLTDGSGVIHPNSRRRIESEDSSIEFSFENFVNIGDTIKIKIKASGVANLQYLSPDSDFGAQSPYIFVFEFIENLPVSALNLVEEIEKQTISKSPNSPSQLARGEMTVYDLSSIEGEDITNEDIIEVGTLAGEERKITYLEFLNRILSDLPAIPPFGEPEDFDDEETTETLTGSQTYNVSNLVNNRHVLIINNVEGGGGLTFTLARGTIAYNEPFYLDTFIRMRAFTGSEVLIRDESNRILATCYIANTSANTHIDNGFSLKGWYKFRLNNSTNLPTLLKL